MELRKVVVPSLKEAFVIEMENQILSGALKIGEKLPPERELVEKTGVSLSVVGAGISELESKGFVEIRPRQGVFVTDYIEKGTVATLTSIMRYNNARLNSREVRSLIESRIVLEQLMVKQVIARGDFEKVKALQQYLDIMRDSRDIAIITDAALDFFHGLSIQSDNILLPLLYNSFRTPMVGMYIRYMEKNGTDTIFNSSSTLFALVCAKKTREAQDYVTEYLTNVIEGKTAIY